MKYITKAKFARLPKAIINGPIPGHDRTIIWLWFYWVYGYTHPDTGEFIEMSGIGYDCQERAEFWGSVEYKRRNR